jgi:branched-chain amino acid transport system permease protein
MTPAGYTIERATTASRLGIVAGAGLLAALIPLPFWGTSSDMRLLVEFLSILTLAQMWNLLAGYGGLVSVGQQAYIGLGGYALNVLADFLGINPFLSVFLAGLVATACALPTAALVFRFQGGYFAVGTWVVAEVYHLLIANSSALGGGLGRSLQAIRGIPRSDRERMTYWIALAVGMGAIALMYLLLRSRRGLALTAIRDSARASDSLGIDVFRSKLLVYLVAAFGCGVAGALLYLNLLRILPTAAFSVNWTASMIFVVVIGGIGTIEGPIVGTLVFFALREMLADYGAWYLMILGAVAIVVMVWAPQGLWGVIAARFDLHFFPVRRRVRLVASMLDARPAHPAGGGSASLPVSR